jgi:hypothetical protein
LKAFSKETLKGRRTKDQELMYKNIFQINKKKIKNKK